MLYRGPCRYASEREEVAAEVVADALTRANDSIERGQFGEALFDLDTALSLMPKSPHAHWNKAQALLSLGDYVAGFREFEWRLTLFGDWLASSGALLWRGENLSGKRVLLCHEYGYGDSLMMLRFVPVLKEQGADITLLLPKALVGLALQFDVQVLHEVPRRFDGFDYLCPMFSVMAGLGVGVGDIPAPPYISANPAKRISKGKRPNIGIAWSGNRTHLRDAHRSIDIDLFLSLFDHRGSALYSVQASESDEAAKRGVITPAYEDFAASASVMLSLDHVVTVDTAAAHLAGAIGHPSVHLLLSYSHDWRWHNARAWYPSMNLHRQDVPGDWASAFAKVNRCLNA